MPVCVLYVLDTACVYGILCPRPCVQAQTARKILYFIRSNETSAPSHTHTHRLVRTLPYDSKHARARTHSERGREGRVREIEWEISQYTIYVSPNLNFILNSFCCCYVCVAVKLLLLLLFGCFYRFWVMGSYARTYIIYRHICHSFCCKLNRSTEKKQWIAFV